MSKKIVIPKEWVCSSSELKPKSGSSSGNTWVFGGKEIKPKTAATFSNTWVVECDQIKPKTGATSANTFDIGGLPVLAVFAHLVLRSSQPASEVARIVRWTAVA
jgi:hypothetical protein